MSVFRDRMRLRPAPLKAVLSVSLLALSFAAAGCTGSEDGADESAVKRVGLMHVGLDHVPSSLTGIVDGLEQLGWDLPRAQVDSCIAQLRTSCTFRGEDIELRFKNLDAKEAAAQARVFVLENVDAIVAFEDTSIEEAQKATSEGGIPVVFLHPSDPVRDGLVESLTRPEGNLTGVFGARDEVDKQLELYQRIVPNLQRLLTLVDPTDKRTERLLKDAQQAAAELPRPLQLDLREVTTANDIDGVFRSLRPGEVDGVFLLSPSLRLNHTAQTIELANKAKLPVQAHRKEWVEQGALFSYGIDLPLVGQASARYIDALLRGTPPSELTVEEVTKLEFAVNLKTASALGIKPPQEMIIRADYVVR